MEEHKKDENDVENVPDANLFKKPDFIKPIKTPTPKITKNSASNEIITTLSLNTGDDNAVTNKITTSLLNADNAASESRTEEQLSLPKRRSLLPIPNYEEPSWGGLSSSSYSIEELKAGVSLRTIPLDDRSFYCFGRLENCHIVMAHPTISRYHAILQYRSTFSKADEKRGFYLYDLESTHGTFLNKQRIKPKTYVKVQVGHIIKLGSSTRMFLLNGPEDDQEPESELTYSELKQLKQKQEEERERALIEEEEMLKRKKEMEEEKGISWGMGEDADEETDLTENPYAVTTDEQLYLDDPKKTLRGWFEREGEEFRYDVEDKGYGQYYCKIELPIENVSGGCLTAEATVSGKKKEAIYQCALEACRILDRNGFLRQAIHESKKKKSRNWEEHDFYDSDEDNFFDRTGELEKKRRKRMQQSGKCEAPVDTYDTLLEKHKKVVDEIETMEEKLKLMTDAALASKTVVPSDLDDFTKNQPVDKIEKRRFKAQLEELKQDEKRLLNFIKLAKPTFMPALKIFDEEAKEATLEKEPVRGQEGTTVRTEKVVEERLQVKTNENEGNIIPKVEKEKEEKNNQVSKKKRERKRWENVQKKNNSNLPPKVDDEDYNNIVWVPPTNQTGDGRTTLNDKLGY